MTLCSTIALFLIASCLSLPTATLSQPIVDKDYTCGTGFIPVQDFGPSIPPQCYVDPCYGNPGPCGAGNQCTVKTTSVSGRTFLESVCTCPPPSVVSHIVYQDFCYLPGTDRCFQPNPCKNGATCTAGLDFNAQRGVFKCNCPPNLQGVTCELPFPGPTATLRNGTAPPTPPPTDQGVCGSGAAGDFPTRCYFNSDPQGRYVCCDNQGCNGFNSDNLIPRCRNYGYVPPGYGVGANPPPPPPPSPPSGGSEGVCGSGAAGDFPLRCWFNNDPQGRYVCCDRDGCNGFAPPDNLFPRCKTNGYAPPGFGV